MTDRNAATPEALLQAALGALASSRAAETAASAQIAVERRRRRRLLQALQLVATYRGSENLSEFAREWSRYWRHACRAFRYAPPGALASLELPEDPAYTMALAVFRIGLRSQRAEVIEAQLSKTLHDLYPEPRLWYVRSFFHLLEEHLLSNWQAADVRSRSPSLLQDPADEGRPEDEGRGAAVSPPNITFRGPPLCKVPVLVIDVPQGHAGRRAQVRIRGRTAAVLAHMVMSQPGIDHTWSALAAAGGRQGAWVADARTLERVGRRIRGQVPPSMQYLWEQSSHGVCWRGEASQPARTDN